MDEVAQPALALLVDIGERPRAGGWSLRAALTRFGQPRAQLASDVTEVLRRLETAAKPYAAVAERAARDQGGAPGADGDPHLEELLGVAADLDAMADALAAWASDISRPRPDEVVEAATSDLTARLDALGVPRESGPPRPGRRRGV